MWAFCTQKVSIGVPYRLPFATSLVLLLLLFGDFEGSVQCSVSSFSVSHHQMVHKYNFHILKCRIGIGRYLDKLAQYLVAKCLAMILTYCECIHLSPLSTLQRP